MPFGVSTLWHLCHTWRISAVSLPFLLMCWAVDLLVSSSLAISLAWFRLAFSLYISASSMALQLEEKTVTWEGLFDFWPSVRKCNVTFVNTCTVFLYWFVGLDGVVPQVKSFSVAVSLRLIVGSPPSSIFFEVILSCICNEPYVVHFKSVITLP